MKISIVESFLNGYGDIGMDVTSTRTYITIVTPEEEKKICLLQGVRLKDNSLSIKVDISDLWLPIDICMKPLIPLVYNAITTKYYSEHSPRG